MGSVLLSIWEKYYCSWAVKNITLTLHRTLKWIVETPETAANELLSRANEPPAAAGHLPGLLLPPELVQVPRRRSARCRAALPREPWGCSSECPPCARLSEAWAAMGAAWGFWQTIPTSQRGSWKCLQTKGIGEFLTAAVGSRASSQKGGQWAPCPTSRGIACLEEFILGCQPFNLQTTQHFLLVILGCNYKNHCN